MSGNGRVVRRSGVLMLALSSVYALLLVPAVRPVSGYHAGIDVWLNLTVDASVIALVALRARAGARDRIGWLLIAGGLAAAFAASASWFGYFQHLDPIPSPSLPDVGWLSFYALLYAGLMLLLRTRVRRMLRSVWLDGLIAGLTVAALADAFVASARVPSWGDELGFVALYPLADLLLLASGVAALAILGQAAGRTWWLLCASFITFAVTDVIYADQVAQGAYTPGDPIDLGWLLARVLLGAAAVVSLGSDESRRRNLEGAAVLAVPAICAVAVLALLVHASGEPVRPTAVGLAAAAALTMVVRTVFTFRELRVLTADKHQQLMGRLVEAHDEERARIAADVHDDSLQALAAVDLRLGALRKRLSAHAPGEAAGVDSVLSAVHEASLRLRHLLFTLETPAIEAALPEALREAAEHVFADSAVRWSVQERTPGALPRGVRVSAYRIAREAMVNAVKHAEASQVSVVLDVQPSGLRVEVVDDGRGMAATRGSTAGRRHWGVTAMRDRAAAAGGWWRADPGPGGVGTAVTFFLPTAPTGTLARVSGSEPPPDSADGSWDADDEVPLEAAPEHDRQVSRPGALQ